jgi:hypothetical protein
VPKLDSDRDLRLSDRDRADAWRGKTTSGVKLEAPRVGGDVPTPPNMQPITPAGGVGAAISTIDQALATLELHGVKGLRLEQERDTGQWRCTCSIPDRQNPSQKHTYDTLNADALSALRAVLDQIDRDGR